MTSFGVELTSGLIGITATSPLAATAGALFGYCYARLGNLPVKQVAIAWAVWFTVEHIFQTLITMKFDDESERSFFKGMALFATSVFGIQMLRNRSQLGDKMALVLVALRALTFFNLISEVNSSVSDD